MRERLGDSDAHHNHMHIQHCTMRDTLDHKELEFSALAGEYYCTTNEQNRLYPDTVYEEGARKGVHLNTVASSAFKDVSMKRAMVTALFRSFLVVAMVHIVPSLKICGSAYHLF